MRRRVARLGPLPEFPVTTKYPYSILPDRRGAHGGPQVQQPSKGTGGRRSPERTPSCTEPCSDLGGGIWGRPPALHPGTPLTCHGLQMTRSVVTPPTTRARPGPSHCVRHPDRGDRRRPGDPVPEEATAQGAGHGPGHGVPPLASLSLSSPGSVNPGVARVGGWSALRTRGHARSAGRGAHGRSHRALSLRSRRAPQAGWARGGVAFPEAWTWAWRRVSRAREPPSSCPLL